MPQILFEYTANADIGNKPELINQIHSLLADRLPTKLASCKTRLVKHEEYAIGDHYQQGSFVALTIKVLKGRKAELLAEISQELFRLLQSFYHAETQLSVEIEELADNYTNG